MAGFESGPGNSKMCYARLWMERLLPDLEYVIYLDSDVLVLGDLSQILHLSREKKSVFMACPDRKISNISEDTPLPLIDHEKALPYFNSGFFITNLAKWRGLGVLQQVSEITKKPHFQCKWHDQTLLNYVFRGQVDILSSEWNWQWEEVPTRGGSSLQMIHYTTGLKPWCYWGGSFRFKAWRDCYKAYVGSPRWL